MLETTMVTPDGSATLTDALAFDADERGHAIGQHAPDVLVRVLKATSGSLTVDAEFAPRPEYGIVHPRLQVIEGGVLARGGSAVLVLAGAATGSHAALGLWMGTGVGGVLILDGRPFDGARGAAGEIGHVVVRAGGALCTCGRRGCVEAYAGRRSMERAVSTMVAAGRGPRYTTSGTRRARGR